jgi:hypothetical protein
LVTLLEMPVISALKAMRTGGVTSYTGTPTGVVSVPRKTPTLRAAKATLFPLGFAAFPKTQRLTHVDLLLTVPVRIKHLLTTRRLWGRGLLRSRLGLNLLRLRLYRLRNTLRWLLPYRNTKLGRRLITA